MKRFVQFLLMSALLAMTFISNARAWDYFRIPGGVALKTIVVDNGGVKGMWIPEKQAGMYWVDWDDANDHFEPVSSLGEFDAYYCWFMGGDACNFGTSENPVLRSLAATYQGVHRYKYETSAWEPYNAPNNIVKNNNWRWHDAVFYSDPREQQPSFAIDNYIVSAVQPWTDGNDWRMGLYLIQNNELPDKEDAPISGPLSHNYNFIHRSLDTQATVFYTWYNDIDFSASTQSGEFQRLTLTATGQAITPTLIPDDSGLPDYYYKVCNFFQAIESGTYYQWIMVDTQDYIGTSDPILYYRVYNNGWEDWEEMFHVRSVTGFSHYAGMGMAVHKRTVATVDYFYVYLNVDFEGLALIKYDLNNPQNPYSKKWLNNDGTNYIRKWNGRSLNMVPNGWLNNSSHDILIVGTAHADVSVVEVDNETETPQVVSIDKLN
ncbi:MAG: hypothetical protein NTW14_09025 [bacterium]|nr:hypothetical protein [bacterium]